MIDAEKVLERAQKAAEIIEEQNAHLEVLNERLSKLSALAKANKKIIGEIEAILNAAEISADEVTEKATATEEKAKAEVAEPTADDSLTEEKPVLSKGGRRRAKEVEVVVEAPAEETPAEAVAEAAGEEEAEDVVTVPFDEDELSDEFDNLQF